MIKSTLKKELKTFIQQTIQEGVQRGRDQKEFGEWVPKHSKGFSQEQKIKIISWNIRGLNGAHK